MPTTHGIMTLRDALIVKLKSLYDIESEIVKSLPKLAKKATDPELRAALEEHLEETKTHVTRLEEAFKGLGEKPGKVKVEAIRGLASDAEWIMKEKPAPEVQDSMLIAAASYVEHYEIAGYTAAIKWSRLLGEDGAESLLEETLKEEEMADDKLQSLADDSIDERAVGDDDESAGKDEEE